MFAFPALEQHGYRHIAKNSKRFASQNYTKKYAERDDTNMATAEAANSKEQGDKMPAHAHRQTTLVAHNIISSKIPRQLITFTCVCNTHWLCRRLDWVVKLNFKLGVLGTI
jgi:hypothetical protein